MAYVETWAPRGEHRVYVRDYPGEEPALVLMHGFPDNLHLYDRLVPRLNPPRRVVTFDFLGSCSWPTTRPVRRRSTGRSTTRSG
jgi:pimeloyl-ACP methyl ester carboxylesterase